MERNRGQNPVHLVTTISVYLGLVLVGASHQVLGQVPVNGESQSRCFEFSSKTASVYSKLKFVQKVEDVEVLSFTFCSNNCIDTSGFAGSAAFTATASLRPEAVAGNDQVFTVSMLPRASI